MPKRSNLYYFRRLHQISLYDLETASDLSNQYISRAELLDMASTPRLESQMTSAVETVIQKRKQELLALEADLLKYRGRLLGLAEDVEHE